MPEVQGTINNGHRTSEFGDSTSKPDFDKLYGLQAIQREENPMTLYNYHELESGRVCVLSNFGRCAGVMTNHHIVPLLARQRKQKDRKNDIVRLCRRHHDMVELFAMKYVGIDRRPRWAAKTFILKWLVGDSAICKAVI